MEETNLTQTQQSKNKRWSPYVFLSLLFLVLGGLWPFTQLFSYTIKRFEMNYESSFWWIFAITIFVSLVLGILALIRIKKTNERGRVIAILTVVVSSLTLISHVLVLWLMWSLSSGF